MPNVNDERQLPKGYFLTMDEGVEFEDFNCDGVEGYNYQVGSKSPTERFYRAIHPENGDKSLLRICLVTYGGNNYWQVSKISTQQRRKGLAKSLYKAAIQKEDYPLISDSTLTMPGSYNIWQSFINSARNGEYVIQVVNANSGRTSEYDFKTPRTRIWGYDSDILEIINEDPDNLEMALTDKHIQIELYEYLRDFHKEMRDRKEIRRAISKQYK